MNKIVVGQWREGPIQVVSFDAPPTGNLDAEVGRFLSWFHDT